MALERKRVLTGTIWEERNGYCRATRVKDMVFVSGTLAADEAGNIVSPDSAYLQTKFALEKIEGALGQVGASREDVVRTRLYVTSLRHESDVGHAHQEFFGQVMPCCTMVEVSALASPMALVEIEVDAVVES